MDYNITYREKDKSIQCIISYKDENGKWKQKSKQGFKRQKDAKPWIETTVEKLGKEISLSNIIDPSLKGITFKELMTLYIEHIELHREYGTVERIKYAWDKFDTLNDIIVTEITNAHTQNCVDKMAKERLSYNTITRNITLIKTVFYYAIDKKIIIDNPLNEMRFPDDKESNKIKAINKYELDDLLKKMNNDKFYISALLASKCGLRAGEILGLTWDRIDFKNMELTVNRQWKKLDKGTWGFGAVKRKNSNRTVPIPPSVIKELIKFQRESVTDINNRIIIYGDTANFSRNTTKNFKRVGYDITIHDLRHTYATLLISNGIDFKTAAKLLGHDIKMTMKTYSHVTDDMMKKAINVVNTIFK